MAATEVAHSKAEPGLGLILNPRHLHTPGLDVRSREILEKTGAFLEAKGKKRLGQDDLDRVWYADFLDFVKREPSSPTS